MSALVYKQEAQWAVLLTWFLPYIPLSNYDQRMLHAKYAFMGPAPLFEQVCIPIS